MRTMAERTLHIAAYDIADHARLREALYVLKHYASGGQKSVFECFLTAAERQALLRDVREVLDLEEDRFLLLPLGSADGIRTLGIGVAPADPDYYFVG